MSHTPVRMCVICRQRFNKALLTRYSVDMQGKLVGDMGQSGRGWYVCSHATCKEKFSLYRPKNARLKKGIK